MKEIKTEVGKFTVKVKKVGRKWLTLNGRCSKEQLEINHLTKDFNEGGIYEVYAKCITEFNGYGATKKYYAIDEGEAKKGECQILLNKYSGYYRRDNDMRERIIKLADNNQDLLDKLKNVEVELRKKETKESLGYLKGNVYQITKYDCDADRKLRYMQEKIENKQDDINFAKLHQDELYKDVREAVVEDCEEAIFDLDSLSAKFKFFEFLVSVFDLEEDSELNRILDKLKEYCNKVYLKRFDEINKLYEEGFPVLAQNVFNCEEYEKYLQKGFISDEVALKVKELEDKMKSLDYSKFKPLIEKVFSTKGYKAFNDTVKAEYPQSRIDKHHDIIDVIFNANKFNDKIYILNARLDRELFKKALSKCGLKQIKSEDFKKLSMANFDEYVCRNPYMLLHEMIKEGYLTLKDDAEANKEKTEEEIDIENILLWSNKISEPFTYKKEKIGDSLYYLVKKEMSYFGDCYDTYHLVGFDNLVNQGFSLKLQYNKKYEDMSVKDIASRIFKEDEGYKHFIDDMVIQELDLKRVEEKKYYLIKTLTINGHSRDYEERMDISSEDVLEEKVAEAKAEKSGFKFTKIQCRKNLYIEGEKSNACNIFKNAVVYCNDKLVAQFDSYVRFNRYEDGTKIKYDLYYEEIKDFEVDCRANIETKVKYKAIDETGKEIFTRDDGFAENLVQANIKVNNNVILNVKVSDINNADIPWYGECSVYGKFTVNYDDTNLEYGEDNKVYILAKSIKPLKDRF